jgi:hypothetical protein
MEIPDGSPVLELEAGWGGVSIELAKAFRVTAFDSDSDRARFIELRARQEGLRLDARAGDLGTNDLESLAAGHFSGVVVHRSAASLGLESLTALRQLLAPGGLIYIGAPNRFTWSGFRGGMNTYRGYEREFAKTGLRIRTAYVSPRGYLNPSELVPFEKNAISHYTTMRLAPAANLRSSIRNHTKTWLAKSWFWKSFGSDFVFFLEAAHA